jgi:hypothetical protein
MIRLIFAVTQKVSSMRESFSCACKTGVKLIDVGGVKVGIIGMDEIFSEYYKAGKKPEDLDENEVLKDFRKKKHCKGE